MLEKLKGLSQKYAEIEYMLSQSEVWADAQKAAALSRCLLYTSPSPRD